MEKMAYFLSFKTSGKAWLREHLPIISVLVIGLFLRTYKIRDYVLFLGDEGRDALAVYNILHGDLTLLGPTSSVGGFFLGPIYYYLMAPFLWLSNYDPAGPSVMVALFGVATIYLVYKLGSEFFGMKTALISSFLYTISPIVIIYSRSSWNPNVFPFFTIASLYALYKAISKNKVWMFVLSGFLMGINLQIHYLATFVGVVMFFYVLLVQFDRNLKWFAKTLKNYAYLFIGFIIGFSPFILFEIRHGFLNTQNIIKFIFTSEETGGGLAGKNILFVFERLFGGLIVHLPRPENSGMFDRNIVQLWIDAGLFLGLFATGFFLVRFFRNKNSKEEFKKYLFLLLWGVLGIGLFGLYKKSIYDYYLGFLFPLPFLLVGLFFSDITEKFKTYGRSAVGIVIVCLILINFKFSPIVMARNNQIDQVKGIALFVLEKTEGLPFNFAIAGAGNSDHAYRYFFKLADQEPVIIKGILEDPERQSVTDQLFVICETFPCSPLGESSNDVAGFGRGEIVDEWDVSVIKVYKLRHYTGQ